MRSFRAALAVCGALLCGCGQAPKTTGGDPKDSEQLSGEWRAVAIEAGGFPLPAARVKELNIRYVFNRNQLSIFRSDGNNKTSTFTVDGSTSPKRLTINQSPASCLF
jgi:uncharacterized protein (TIGR03067 family)